MELRDSERHQFMKERARVESERAAAALQAAQARKDKAGRYTLITKHMHHHICQQLFVSGCNQTSQLYDAEGHQKLV